MKIYEKDENPSETLCFSVTFWCCCFGAAIWCHQMKGRFGAEFFYGFKAPGFFGASVSQIRNMKNLYIFSLKLCFILEFGNQI